MVSSIGSILRQSYLKEVDRLNILTFVTHERYEPNLCLTGHNFYSLTGEGTRGWNNKVAPVPNNYQIYKVADWNSNVVGLLPIDVEIDCIIAQNRFAHLQIAKNIQKHVDVPLISIEHTDTMPNWPEEYIKKLSEQCGDINVFISDYSKERWLNNDGIVIEHMIDVDLFKPGVGKRQNYILSMCNDWINRDMPCGFSVWNRVIQGFPFKVVGETPGLSKGTNSIEECIKELQQASIFLNTSQFSPVPMSLLEAMACGCAIVSSATCMIPEIIENGVNGFISNDEEKLREYLNTLLYDDALRQKLGDAARQTVIDRFGKDKFLNAWSNIFDRVRSYK